jgi:hypothetical protein
MSLEVRTTVLETAVVSTGPFFLNETTIADYPSVVQVDKPVHH